MRLNTDGIWPCSEINQAADHQAVCSERSKPQARAQPQYQFRAPNQIAPACVPRQRAFNDRLQSELDQLHEQSEGQEAQPERELTWF